MDWQLKNVLIIEDDDEIAEIEKYSLSSMDFKEFELNITTVDNGDEALTRLGRTKYDLVFVDLKLPGVGGEELIKQIRAQKNGLNCTTPFVVVSGYVQDFQVGSQLDHIEKVAFLEKPFDEKKLQRIAKIWLISGNTEEESASENESSTESDVAS